MSSLAMQRISGVRKLASNLYQKGKKYSTPAKRTVASALKTAEQVSKMISPEAGKKVRQATQLVKDTARTIGIKLPTMSKRGSQFVIIKATKKKARRTRKK